MNDEHVDLLVSILTHPNSKVWAINLGELPAITSNGWENISSAVKNSCVTHMFLDTHCDKQFRISMQTYAIQNSKKHDYYYSESNGAVIRATTHMWCEIKVGKKLINFKKIV